MENQADLPSCPGIYQVRNKVNGKIYIGSSNNLRRRFREHLSAFFCKRNAIRLQREYDMYGDDAFEFIVMQTCEEGIMYELEQSYLDKYNPEYNSFCKVSHPKITEDTSKRISDGLHKIFSKEDFIKRGHHCSELKKKRGYVPSKDTLGRYSVKSKEMWTRKEYREKMSAIRLSGKAGNFKLTKEQVLEIRRDYVPRVVTSKILAKKYNVSIATIKGIVTRVSWKNI